MTVGTIGVAAYLYRELVAPHVVPVYDYTVSSVRRLNRTTAELGLSPRRKALAFVPGQLVVVAFGGLGGWQWHPFSVSGSATGERLEATVYREEIEAAAARHPSLRVHFVVSDTQGRLSADEVIEALRPAINPWIYMCGPPAMNRALARGFRQLGVPASRIRWEQFDAR